MEFNHKGYAPLTGRHRGRFDAELGAEKVIQATAGGADLPPFNWRLSACQRRLFLLRVSRAFGNAAATIYVLMLPSPHKASVIGRVREVTNRGLWDR